jgi:arginyl-tRNA synthetase
VIRDQLADAVRAAVAASGLPDGTDIRLDVPKQREHGDFATNVALQLAKAAGRPPRELAQQLADEVTRVGVPHLARIEIAGPGFLNFHLDAGWLHAVLRTVVDADTDWGRGDELAGRVINLEFVSANPTGPLHAGGGRWIASGDAIANLLAARGATVEREYYLNDTGNQLVTFTASLSARYHGTELPDDGYRGEYLVELADQLRAGDAPGSGEELTDDELRELGLQRIIAGIRDDLARIGVRFDTWFSERSLHERGEVADVLRILGERNATYERDGATWLRSTDYGDERDRVLVKSDGSTTYLCNDLAYHRDKLRRGADHLINIWGADHHAQVKSLQAGLTALLGTHGEPEIILGQLVKLVRNGQEVRLSKRAGDIVTLSDILDDVDADVARMTFLLQSLDTKQTFDLDVVTSQSMENPVYYVQMAHARIASIGRRAVEAGVVRQALADVDLSVLMHERETDLLRALDEYPEIVQLASAERAPHKVTHWVLDFAGRFHGFYHDCPVLRAPEDVQHARLWLTEACRVGLANALGILGVHAPDEIARLQDDTDDDESSE